jgi:hypothetical protein
MSRLTDNDRHFGPMTWGRCGGWKPLRLVLSSGGDPARMAEINAAQEAGLQKRFM